MPLETICHYLQKDRLEDAWEELPLTFVGIGKTKFYRDRGTVYTRPFYAIAGLVYTHLGVTTATADHTFTKAKTFNGLHCTTAFFKLINDDQIIAKLDIAYDTKHQHASYMLTTGGDLRNMTQAQVNEQAQLFSDYLEAIML